MPLLETNPLTEKQVRDIVNRYNGTGDSIRAVAKRYGLSYHRCRAVLFANGALIRLNASPGRKKNRKIAELSDLAARDHAIRRVLIALRDNKRMYLKQITRLPGCTGAHYQVEQLLREGYLTETETTEGRLRYRYLQLSPEGERLLVRADGLYQLRQPGALAARHDQGESFTALAAAVNLSRVEVAKRVHAYNGGSAIQTEPVM